MRNPIKAYLTLPSKGNPDDLTKGETLHLRKILFKMKYFPHRLIEMDMSGKETVEERWIWRKRVLYRRQVPNKFKDWPDGD